MRIAFDVGGVLSKYPEVFKPMMVTLSVGGADVIVISDVHPVEKIVDMLYSNGLYGFRTYSADYKQHGELCKAKLCEELGVDILVDDFIGYVATGKHVRLLVMPDPELPYYADSWVADGLRRNPPGSKRPPEDR